MQDKIRALSNNWEKVKGYLLENPNVSSSIKFPLELNLDEIDNIIITIVKLGEKIHSHRDSPKVLLAKSLAQTSLQHLIQLSSTAIQQNYNLTHVQNFITGAPPHLNSILMAFTNIFIAMSSNKSTLSEMAEEVALLSHKITEASKSVEASVEIIQSLENNAESIKTLAENAKEMAEGLGNLSKQAKSTSDEIYDMKQEVEGDASELKSLRQSIETGNNDLTALGEKATELLKDIDEIKRSANDTLKTVEGLLPGATSAGLAHSFRIRKDNLEKNQKWWITGFVLSLLALASIAIYHFGQLSNSLNLAVFYLESAPFYIPLIWLAWFFARNHGHRSRLIEEYAYKEAISHAFEGYKKQMQEVSPDEGLSSLCNEVIGILSSNPQHVFERVSSDESPAHHLMDKLGRGKSKKIEKATDKDE